MTTLAYLFINDRLPESEFDARLKFFTVEQQSRIRSFSRWQDAHASLFGKLLVLEGFKSFSVPVRLEDLKATSFGKPYVQGSPVTFNISHSGSCVTCVFSNDTTDIGIDVEEVKPIDISDFDGVWNERERDQIDKGGLHVFYKYWTRKEAIAKAEGKGLSTPLLEIDVAGELGRYRDKLYHITQVTLQENFIINIASMNRADNIKIIESSYLFDNMQ